MRALTRREFIAVSSAAGVATVAAACGPDRADDARATAQVRRNPDPVSAGPPLDRIGLQLYTVRSLMADDFEGTLERAARIGYEEVEFAGYFGRSPEEVRSAVDRAGLAAPSAHVPFEALEGEWERTLDDAAAIGNAYVVVPWIPAERRTLEGYGRVAESLNRAGERARAAGLRLGYHNHDFEFEAIDGRLPYDILLTETDPALVALEMDLYWITKGGEDPLAWFERFPGRFELVHVKDMAAGAEQRMTEVGDGIIDFGAIFARVGQAGIRHAFVEHDSPAEPLASIRASYDFLSRLEP